MILVLLLDVVTWRVEGKNEWTVVPVATRVASTCSEYVWRASERARSKLTSLTLTKVLEKPSAGGPAGTDRVCHMKTQNGEIDHGGGRRRLRGLKRSREGKTCACCRVAGCQTPVCTSI
jgi:hypothetical protein